MVRRFPALTRLLSFAVAGVLLTLCTVCEALHGRLHADQNAVPAARSASPGYAVRPDTVAVNPSASASSHVHLRADVADCPLCEWEAVFAASPGSAVVPLFAVATVAHTPAFVPVPPDVRLIAALRSTRGPPRLA